MGACGGGTDYSFGTSCCDAVAAASWGPLADSVGQWLNVLQSVQLPFALLPVLIYTDSSRIMGAYRNSRFLSSICWLLAGVVMLANAYLVIDFVTYRKSPT